MTMSDSALLPATIEAVLAAPVPERHLQEQLDRLYINQEFTQAAALFESALSRGVAISVWGCLAIWPTYRALGRLDLAFYVAVLAMRTNPPEPTLPIFNGIIFKYFLQQGRTADAADIFLKSFERFPSAPLAPHAEIAVHFKDIDAFALTDADRPPPPSRHDRRIIEPSVLPAWSCPAGYGRPLHNSFANQPALQRSAIDIATLYDGELLIVDSQFVARSAEGLVQTGLSLSEFPNLVDKLTKISDGRTQNFDVVEVEEAIVVKDTTPGNNFGHFLIDQLPKLALYEAAGIDVTAAAIVGEKLTTGFQREIIDALGIKHYIEMDRRIILRAKRLHICSDCIQPQLIAHYGENWGLNFMRRAFGIAPLDGLKTQSTGTRRLYISRNDGTTRRISNEDEILPILKEFGFEMIRPGSMSFLEQVEAFKDASHIFGPHGANLANMIFAPAGLNLLECFHPLFTPFNYMRIVPALSMNYAAMIATDAESDDPRFNDPETAVPWRPDVPFVWHYRNIRVDPVALTSWLTMACPSQPAPVAG